LIDSQHLEGELNDILAGDAHPGFHLFATINPPEYSGRKPLSPALKGRFRHLPIRQYSPTELQTIAEKVLPETRQGKIIAEQLTKLHCRLRAYLQRKKLPLQPTSLDLQNVARAVVRGGDFTEKALHQCLNQYYRLYLVAAKTSLEILPGSSALAIGKSGLDIELCKWFNQTFSRINRPWVIRRSYLNSIDEKSHEIRIKDKLSDTEIRTEIVKRMAEAKWRANGLPLRPGRSEDIIIQALYQHWLTRWFDLEYGQAGANADSLFQMTEEVKRTLQTLASRGYLQEADQRIEAWHADDARLWPAFWHQMSDMANRWVDDFTEEALADEKTAIASDHDPKQYISEVEWEKAPALDWSTNFEDQVEQHYVQCEVFNTRNYPLNMYRWWAMDVYVTAQGDIRQLVINDKHIHGFDTLKPERLPEHGREVALASNQTLATFEIPSNIDKYALPSLKANDYIVALRVEPDLPFTLIRDRYTGLHTLYFTEASTRQGIKCAYIIEHRESGKKTPAKRARPNRSIRSDACCSEGMKTVLNKLFKNANEQPPEVQVILSRIENAKNTEQKVEAITDYCRSFSGNFKPERPKNFFDFLVTKRQGSCRHRAPVFVAFCRYFGIPSRQIGSRIHRFAEYSGDGGKTWKSVDLGGATSRLTKIIPHFQPTIRFSRSSSEFNKIKTLLKDILKSADSAQQQALAKACGVSLEELNRILESALPAANLDIHKVARKLWEEKDLTGFSLGVSILESLETDLLGHREKELVSVVSRYPGHICKSMSDAVIRILSDSDKDLVTEQLNLLHSKMIDQAGVSRYQWLTSMVYTLAKCDPATPSFILFAREALESGWLDPLPTYESEVMRADCHHWLLERLEDVDELKVQATHCLKKWYGELLSREKNSQVWQLAYERFQKNRGATLFVTHCHDGFSRLLEKKIASSLIQPVWTDQPEGVPDIERMLVHNPAFPQLISGKGNHRPVIIMGEPSRHETGMAEKTEALFRLNVENSPELKRILEKVDQCEATKQQYYSDIQALEKDHRKTLGYQKNHAQKEYEKKNLAIKSWYKPIIESLEASPEDRKLLDDLRKKCSRAIWQAFSHYLYGMANSKGGCLTYCWAKASFGASMNFENYGAHAPSSPEELYAMMSVIEHSHWVVQAIKENYLRQAHDASDALILKSDELTKIAEEFFNNVNLKSISNALV
ncbi:transglutaminase-like domain-containing protein, partial [Endozoicomonas sp. SESOKO2]